jgi:hypothetical protein
MRITAFLLILGSFNRAAPQPSLANVDPLIAAVVLHARERSPAIILVGEVHAWKVRPADLARSLALSKAEKAEFLTLLGGAERSAWRWERVCDPASCHLVPPSELASIGREDGSGDPDARSARLRTKYGTSTVVELGPTAVVRDKAVVYWSEQRGLLDGRLVASVLWKSEKGWKVLEDVEILVS